MFVTTPVWFVYLAHRPQTSPLDSSLISRLLAPTQSSLARSKSAATLSADGKDSPGNSSSVVIARASSHLSAPHYYVILEICIL